MPRRPGGVWFKGNKQAVGIEQFISIQLEAFPEKAQQISIHDVGSSWVVGRVLANTTLTLLAAALLTFPLICKEPKKRLESSLL